MLQMLDIDIYCRTWHIYLRIYCRPFSVCLIYPAHYRLSRRSYF